VGEAEHEQPRTPQGSLLGALPCHRPHLRHVVTVRADRTYGHGDSRLQPRMGLLDQADRRRCGLHWRSGVHVRPVPHVPAAVSALASLQQRGVRAGGACGAEKEPGAAAGDCC